MKSNAFVSVVTALQNDERVVEDFVREAAAVLSATYRHHELILVDDWSTDATAEIASKLLKELPCLRLIRLSRRYGSDVAITAGLESSIGDFVAVMQVDCDPPEELPRLVEQARQSGVDVVLGAAINEPRESWLRQGLRGGFRAISRRTLGLAPSPRGSFRGFTRRAVNAITRVKQKQRYLSLLCCSIGFSQTSFAYRKVFRTAVPRRRGLLEAFDLGVGSLVTHSTAPLRWVTWTGGLASGLNLLYVLYIFAVNLIKPDVAKGWTTLSLQASTMFFVNFLILAVMSEYVGRILGETRVEPLYHVQDELASAVPPPQMTRNVIEQATDEPPRELKHAA